MRHKLSAQERLEILEHAQTIMFEFDILKNLRLAEAPKALEKFRAFKRSLDGAVRNAANHAVRERQG